MAAQGKDLGQAGVVDESEKSVAFLHQQVGLIAQSQVVGTGNVRNRLEDEIVSDVLARDIAT